jgi:hypothetical protein
MIFKSNTPLRPSQEGTNAKYNLYKNLGETGLPRGE